MLIDRIVDSYRDMTGHTVQAQPVITVPVVRTAANAGHFEKSAMQARRQRRLRRMDRSGQRNINGWTVRAW
jgi:hypothetical protein